MFDVPAAEPLSPEAIRQAALDMLREGQGEDSLGGALGPDPIATLGDIAILAVFRIQ